MAAGGQTINDRLNAVRYALSGQGLARTVCKATTLEVLGPKKKHIDYLLACTNEPNVSTPQLANLLIERTLHTNWAVVFKSLISIHHLMSYGNERFTQYLATSNHNFELNEFMDRTTPQGYNMSAFVRRYAKYINDKTISYRLLAIDLCKIRSGNDNALRTMNMDNLSKTLPIVQTQFDSLLEFCAEPKDLNNGVIMAAFRLLYKDLVRLYVAYQEAIINLLERYFKLGRKKAREALDMYKKYLARMDKVDEFLRVVDAVGLDKSEQIDLTRSPASILPALEQHLAQLEARKRGATPSTPPGEDQQQANSEAQTSEAPKKEEKENEAPVEQVTKPAVATPTPPASETMTATKSQPPPKPARPVSPIASPKKSPQAVKPPPPSSSAGASSKSPAPAEKKAPPSRPPPPPSKPPAPSTETPKAAPASSSTIPSHTPPPPHPPPPASHHAHSHSSPTPQVEHHQQQAPASEASSNTNGQSTSGTPAANTDEPSDPPANSCSTSATPAVEHQPAEEQPGDAGLNHSEENGSDAPSNNEGGCGSASTNGETLQEQSTGQSNHVNNGNGSVESQDAQVHVGEQQEEDVLPPPPPPIEDTDEQQRDQAEVEPTRQEDQNEVNGQNENDNESAE